MEALYESFLFDDVFETDNLASCYGLTVRRYSNTLKLSFRYVYRRLR